MRGGNERLGALFAMTFAAALAACQPTKSSPSSSPGTITDRLAVPSAPALAAPRGKLFTVSRVVDEDTFEAEGLAAEGGRVG